MILLFRLLLLSFEKYLFNEICYGNQNNSHFFEIKTLRLANIKKNSIFAHRII